MMKNYQRRHLRAPFKESVLFADEWYVHKAKGLNISEGGILLGELPNFPAEDEVPLLLSLPQFPILKNFSLLKMETFSKELFPRQVIRARGRMVRREELRQSLDNIFRSNFALEFVHITEKDQRHIQNFVENFAGNLIFLQTLIDSFNTDEETKIKVRTLARILGYTEVEKISHLRAQVTRDYKSLQWL